MSRKSEAGRSLSHSKKRSKLTRRDWLRAAALASVSYFSSGWLRSLAEDTATNPQRKRACILLWMAGGPSQTDTFDLKPEHANGGEFKPIDTSVPGIQISEHLPQVAQQMEHLSIIRSMSTREGDHQRATYLMRTGYLPQGPIHYPTLGSLISRELGPGQADLPNFISIGPNRALSPTAFGPGFLGPRYAPLVVGEGAAFMPTGEGQDVADSLRVRNLERPAGVDVKQADARLSILAQLEEDFTAARPGLIGSSHRTAYQRAIQMMRSGASSAFSLENEPAELREKYGMNQFGQGCLLARRLVEQGVPFCEVTLSNAPGTPGWDTHADNFNGVKALSEILDPAWGTLMSDLQDRGLLDSTLIIWMGEFGRTPNINGNTGRDHFPLAWTTVLGGGGINGGQVYGSSTDDGMKVKDSPARVGDLIATVCQALGIDPMQQNMSNVGRPIRIADPEAQPIESLVASRNS